MIVQAAYKCPLCGKLWTYGDPFEIEYEQIPALLGKIVQNQLFAGNPILHQAPMHIACKCPDGSGGLAAFAGFLKVEDQKQIKRRLKK